MRNELDIYCDASLRDGVFGIGILAKSGERELVRIAEIIPENSNVSNINEAEFYAILKSLSIVSEAKIQDSYITIYTDNLIALNGIFGQKSKALNDALVHSMSSTRRIVRDILNNKIFITKIPSEYNHGLAHDLANDAVSFNTYERGNLNSIHQVKSDMNISNALFQIEQDFKNATTSVYLKKVELDELKEEVEKQLNEIKANDEYNQYITSINQELNSRFEDLNNRLDTHNSDLELLDSNIHEHDTLIVKLSSELRNLNCILKDVKEENAIKIKLLKEEFERLSVKAHFNSNNKTFVS